MGIFGAGQRLASILHLIRILALPYPLQVQEEAFHHRIAKWMRK